VSRARAAIAAGTVGNVIEWYDFALYGYLASVLATLFFPTENRAVSLIATYGVFAAGFVMRPLGAAVFGWLGDTIGRSRTMLSVVLMALPTVAIGLLPTYESAGIVAPILLVVVRVVQGFSVGGEFSSSVTYMVETAPGGRRGLFGSFANVGSMIGMLAGSGAAAVMTSLLDSATLMDWGWRVPFLAGGVTGIVATLMRRRLPESPHFAAHESGRGEVSPLREALTTNRREVIQATLFASAYGSVFYLAFVYLPTWASEYAGVTLAEALRFNTLATAAMLPVIPLAGWLSDRYLRRTHLLMIAFLALGGIAIPLGAWMTAGGGFAAVAAAQLACALLLAVPCGVAPALLWSASPRGTGSPGTRCRSTWGSASSVVRPRRSRPGWSTPPVRWSRQRCTRR